MFLLNLYRLTWLLDVLEFRSTMLMYLLLATARTLVPFIFFMLEIELTIPILEAILPFSRS